MRAGTPGSGRQQDLSRQMLREILRAVREIRYGSVEIVIHDSRVVQIERRERLRIDPEKKRA